MDAQSTATSYVHLHVHSYYTLLGATASPEALARRAAEVGCTHLALTDAHALYGAVAFDRACREVGVTPLLGMTVNVTWPEDLAPLSDADVPLGEIVLLAQNPTGYRSLCALSSWFQGRADRETALRHGASLDVLRAHAEGVLCLTGGRRGWIARALRAGRRPLAHRLIGKLAGIYTPYATYLSLEHHTAADRAVNQALDALGERMGLPRVAVQPVYTLGPDETARLRLLAAIARNCPLDAVPASALPHGGDRRVAVHWLDADELAARFADVPDALPRTVEVAERCEPALPDGTMIWPALELPDDQTPAQALTDRAEAGVRRRYPQPLPPPVAERLAHELDVINRQGYAPLFLVVADVVRFAREHDLPVSTRGSVANSLVAYALDITTVDPVKHDLLFERFLSPGRADPPDIDLDFCSRRRDEVLAYVRRTYGEEHVALVATVSTLRLRSAAREAAKAYGLDAAALKPLLAVLPRRRRPGASERTPLVELLGELDSPRLREVARAAYGIAGVPHHLSVHPGGVVITPAPLTDVLPVQWTPKGFLVTQFDHHDVEALGLPKLDFLGIRALTVLADAAECVRQRHGPDFRLTEIPLDDAATAELIAGGGTVGVFQCESLGARRTLRQLQARSVRDLAVANAFFKPGPATGGQADAFVRRYRGEAEVRYLHPALAPILAPTQGVLLFQEQILRVATEIAGLSWEQADHLRRGMSRMRPEEMARMQTDFEAGCRRPPPQGPGFSERQAQRLWEQVAAFSGYGFNQGHATAYADVSFRSAYLKAHYPAPFLWARLRNRGGYFHPAVYVAEAVRLGVDVRAPHVNHSDDRVALTAVDGAPTLWLGLGLVRSLRRRAIADLIAARADGPFTDLRDLLVRVPLQPREITHLIQCGAVDDLGENRPTLLREAELLQRAGSARQLSLGLVEAAFPPASLTQRFTWERELLGFPIAALRALFPRLRADHADLTTLAALRSHPGRRVRVLGVRLPGWHRAAFAFWDGADWGQVRRQGESAPPPTWTPMRVRGVWREDRWGTGWLELHGWKPVALTGV
jgi:DNA-directed DNA polymerase III PolC